jgi:OmpA-like transmembrane domain
MRDLKKLVVGITLMTLTSLASADVFDSLYVSTDLGRSIFNSSCSGISPTYTSCKDYDFSHRTSLGILVADFTNAELSYYSSGQLTKKGAGNNYDMIDSVEWQLSGIRYFPIGDGRLSALTRVGIVHWEASETNAFNHINASGNNVLLGVGGRYFLTKGTALRAQLETHRVGNSTTSWNGNIIFISTGITYQFH